MDRVLKINQAYDQKPWRKQLQRLVLFLALLVFFAIVAGINLSVNAKAATIGRHIQYDWITIKNQENAIINQQALLARLTSITELERRAFEMGFRNVAADEITYLVVEGYPGRSPAVLAVENKAFVPASSPVLSPEYSQTLFDWVLDQLSFPSLTTGIDQP